ncbi:MAG: shikimate dehydrogenase [Vicinamibacterales bacterium]
MRDPQLCVTVTGRTMEELRRGRDAAVGADLLELRLDGVDHPDAAAALEGRLRPAIVTCRPRWEGGGFDGSEQERRRLLLDAIEAGAEFVDLELRAAFTPELVRLRRGRGVIVSSHVFGTPPRDLSECVRSLRSSGAEVIKFAYEAHSLSDTLPLFDLAAGASLHTDDAQDHVLLAMGASGTPTRVLAARLGNRWTYAGDAVAPGQVPGSQLLGEFGFRRIRRDGDLYGVVGNPIAHSLSPAMHNAGFAERGLNATYLALHATDADDFVRFARAMKLRGASITAPFKVSMMDRVDQFDALAAEVGALNTLHVRGDRWFGSNTDVAGFMTPLKGRMALKRTRAAVLGAGGAARAVAVALKREGADVRVCARRADQARAVAALVGVNAGTFPPPPGTWDVLVNATSGGGETDASPMEGVPLDGEIVFDLVYSPAETQLVQQARRAGCWTIGGIEMLIVQAERQFELWTGAAPPPDLFRQAVEATAGRTFGRRS